MAASVPAGAKLSGPKINVGGPPRLLANAAPKKVDTSYVLCLSIFMLNSVLCPSFAFWASRFATVHMQLTFL